MEYQYSVRKKLAYDLVYFYSNSELYLVVIIGELLCVKFGNSLFLYHCLILLKLVVYLRYCVTSRVELCLFLIVPPHEVRFYNTYTLLSLPIIKH